jgi:hypothetical protein
MRIIYKDLQDFLENGNLDVHIDQFSKIMSKCSNLKRCQLGLLYIIKTIASIQPGSKHL